MFFFCLFYAPSYSSYQSVKLNFLLQIVEERTRTRTRSEVQIPSTDSSTSCHSYIKHILQTYREGNIEVGFCQVHDFVDIVRLVTILLQFGTQARWMRIVTATMIQNTAGVNCTRCWDSESY